jgi:UDP-N-acetylglucosamine 1-carboxyvinyltransferase
MSKFVIKGGTPLSGEVTIGGSKNASLPILAATLLAESPSTLKNVPDISDVHAFLKILSNLGAETSFDNGTVTINPARLEPNNIDNHLVKHMRASILLLGPLLARFKEVNLAYPGGCVLGKRSVHAHIHALTAFGANLIESTEAIHLKADDLHSAKIVMTEASVTATENALMIAATLPGETQIFGAAMEPHVQDLCDFLVKMGAKIDGIGTQTLVVSGGQQLKGADHEVTPDYLEAGTYALAGVLTNGEITINSCPVNQLDSFWGKLEEVGAKFILGDNTVKIQKHGDLKAIEKLQTAIYPGFPTDLQAPFSVLLTQCRGESRVYETLFEGRLNYLPELNRLGAKTEIQNLHQAIIYGPTPLTGAPIASCDIRAGAAMVLAAMIAKGETVISDINYIDRGYEKLEGKLRKLGAKIERIKE